MFLIGGINIENSEPWKKRRILDVTIICGYKEIGNMAYASDKMVKGMKDMVAILQKGILGLAVMLSVYLICLLTGCSPLSQQHNERGLSQIYGESLVLVKTEPGYLCYDKLVPGTIKIRNYYDPNREDVMVYQEGKDYEVNYEQGTIKRTKTSHIPDFSKNTLYGQKNFDHLKFPGYGNRDYFIWVDYQNENGFPLCEETNQLDRLPKLLKKLIAGEKIKVVVFGDSISTGGDVSEQKYCFANRYVKYLSELYPDTTIELENTATAGDSTETGLSRLKEKVLNRQPDLVLIGFGMNDNNLGGPTPEKFEQNLITMVQSIRKTTGADVILLSAFPPNPEWKYGSHRMEQYADATKRASKNLNCAYADVYAVWAKVLNRKDYSSILGNNINHPNDFGHWLYFLALKNITFVSGPPARM
jgi:acyl-CoA thioesterase-1